MKKIKWSKNDVKDYTLFGSPQQKIGNFTQTKIGGFS